MGIEAHLWESRERLQQARRAPAGGQLRRQGGGVVIRTAAAAGAPPQCQAKVRLRGSSL